MAGIGTMTDADLLRLGNQVLPRLLSGEYAKYAADRRVRDTVRQLAEMMYEATGNIPTGLLSQYFAMPQGAVPTAKRIQEQRDLARWLAEQTGDVAWAERFAPNVRLGEPTAAQRFSDLGWNEWLRGQRGMTINPATGQQVPIFDYLMFLARTAAASGAAAGPESSPWFAGQAGEPSPAPAPASSQGSAATPPVHQGQGTTQPLVHPAAPIDVSGLGSGVVQGNRSLIDQLSRWLADLWLRYSPVGNTQVEEVFQQLKPQLEKQFPDRMQLARILAGIPEEELVRQFGSPAMVSRIRMWAAYGK